MAYLIRSDLTPGRIPPDFFLSALDDNHDGHEDVGLANLICAQASADVDGYLTRYSPPLANPPALVKAAAIAFAGYEVYRRKGFAEAPQNPFARDRDHYRDVLEQISNGKDLGLQSGPDPVHAITEPAKTHSGSNQLLF